MAKMVLKLKFCKQVEIQFNCWAVQFCQAYEKVHESTHSVNFLYNLVTKTSLCDFYSHSFNTAGY